jgi:hypothetical protein
MLLRQLPDTLKQVWSRYGWLDLRHLEANGQVDRLRGMTLLSPQAIVDILLDPALCGSLEHEGLIPAVYCGGHDFLYVNHPSHHPDAILSLSPELIVAPSIISFLAQFEGDQDMLQHLRDEAWERDRPGWVSERSDICRRLEGPNSLEEQKNLAERVAGLDVLLAMPLGRTQTKRLVDEAILASDACGLQDMKLVMERLKEAGPRLDVRLARRLASEALSALSLTAGPVHR